MKNLYSFLICGSLCFLLLSCSKEQSFTTVDREANATAHNSTTKNKTLIFFSSSPDGTLTTLDEDGNVAWQVTKSPYYFSETPCIKDSILYIKAHEAGRAYIMALNAFTGKRLWLEQIATDDFDYSNPYLSAEGILYVGIGKSLIAFNTNTRTIVWKFDSGVSDPDENVFSSPTVVNGTLYVTDKRNVYAFNVYTGAIKWQKQENNMQVHPSSPTVEKGHIIYTTNNSIVCLSLSGANEWTFNLPYYNTLGSVAYDSGFVYCVSSGQKGARNYENDVYALNLKNGQIAWNIQSFETTKTKTLQNIPFFRNGNLHIPFNNAVKTYDAYSGNLKWSSKVNDAQSLIYSTGEVCGMFKLVIVPGNDGVMYAFDSFAGKRLWTYRFSTGTTNVNSSPVILTSTGRIIYPTSSGMTQ